MSKRRLIVASGVGRGTSSRTRRKAHRIVLLVLFAVAVSLGAAPVAAASSSTLQGTGAPLPPNLVQGGVAPPEVSVVIPTTEPHSSPAEPGAHPAQQALVGGSSTGGASSALAPLVLTPSTRESIYWYSWFTSHENCWQAGEPRESAYRCDTVGPYYLPTGPQIIEGAVTADILTTRSGDYCNDYNLGEGLDTTDTANELSVTGFETPTPFGAYQEANHYSSTCQAHEAFWGQKVSGTDTNKCAPNIVCGIQHYISLAEQGLNDLPWSSSFGEPTLVISANTNPWTGQAGFDWGYVCPLLEEPHGNILEYCLAQWTGTAGPHIEHYDAIGACASVGSHAVDQPITAFAPNMRFATEFPESKNTFSFTGSNSEPWRRQIAGITKGDLESAISLDMSEKHENSQHYNEGGCSTPSSKRVLSTNPSEYALIGIEHGTEGGGFTGLGASTGNLQAWTEYTALRPTATTTAASNIQEEGVLEASAALNGTVNPNALQTHYYFEYGSTTSYGKTWPQTPGELAPGTSSVPVSSTITGLPGGSTYHYRLVAVNPTGTSTGEDKTFSTPLTPSPELQYINGKYEMFVEGPNHSLWQIWPEAGTWHKNQIEGENTTFSNPVAQDIEGKFEIWIQGPNHSLWQVWPESGTWHKFQVEGENTTYSSPIAQNIEGKFEVWIQGPKHSLWQVWPANGEWHKNQVEGENTTFSNPVAQDIEGKFEVWVQGPSHSLWQVWPESGSWHKFQVEGENTTFSNPKADKLNGKFEIMVQGTGQSLVQVWAESGAWHSAVVASNAFS